jgi:hypothetical protein
MQDVVVGVPAPCSCCVDLDKGTTKTTIKMNVKINVAAEIPPRTKCLEAVGVLSRIVC